MRTEELDYHLPRELVATRPAEPRDAARMMVVSRSDPSLLEHVTVRDLTGFMSDRALAAFNVTRVVPARFVGVREDTGGKIEGLYLSDGPREGTWIALIKARRFRAGAPIQLETESGEPSGVHLHLLERDASEGGAWIVRVECEDGEHPDRALERVGLTPLPPYIRAARKAMGIEEPDRHDRAWYQTVYAERAGSVAAPTAGLHFTPDLLRELASRGIERADVLLHVGTGTFRPIETETLEEHEMHREWCSVPRESANAISRAKAEGRPVVCVGTTSARCVESFAPALVGDEPLPEMLDTDLMIAPGYRWRVTDGLMTNFHLPRSTLLAMVASLFPEGMERLRAIYGEAVGRGYRFYSYGDAMLVLP